jgi:hypothetical protein
MAIAWLALLGLRSGFYRGEREILLFAWLAPVLMPPVQLLTAVQLGFPAVFLVLLAAVRRAAPLDDAGRRRLNPLKSEAWVER